LSVLHLFYSWSPAGLDHQKPLILELWTLKNCTQDNSLRSQRGTELHGSGLFCGPLCISQKRQVGIRKLEDKRGQAKSLTAKSQGLGTTNYELIFYLPFGRFYCPVYLFPDFPNLLLLTLQVLCNFLLFHFSEVSGIIPHPGNHTFACLS